MNIDKLPYEMTLELAFEVVRIKTNASWRRLSEILSQKYPDVDFGDGNQVYGSLLDQEAVAFIQEHMQALTPEQKALYLTDNNKVIRAIAEGDDKRHRCDDYLYDI